MNRRQELEFVQLDPDTLEPMSPDDPRWSEPVTEAPMPTAIFWGGDGYYEYPDGAFGKRGKKL